MKNLIIAVWVLGIVMIAIAAALNPFANNNSAWPTATRRQRTIYAIMMFLAVTGIGCIVGAILLWFLDVWWTIR